MMVAGVLWLCMVVLPGVVSAAPSVGDVIYNHILRYQQPDIANIITCDILGYSAKYDVDPLLITALFTQESGFNMYSTSDTGAIGIAQLQPDTAQMLGFYPYDLHQNIEGGVSYFATQQRNFRKFGSWCLTYAVAAYNAGPGAIYDYNGVPPYEETQGHVQKIYNIHVSLMRQMQ